MRSAGALSPRSGRPPASKRAAGLPPPGAAGGAARLHKKNVPVVPVGGIATRDSAELRRGTSAGMGARSAGAPGRVTMGTGGPGGAPPDLSLRGSSIRLSKEQRAGVGVPRAGVPALVDDFLDDESENEEDISSGGERADSADEGLEEDEEVFCSDFFSPKRRQTAAASHQAEHPAGSRSQGGASAYSPAGRAGAGRSPGSKVDGASVSAQGSTLRSSDDEVNQVRPCAGQGFCVELCRHPAP